MGTFKILDMNDFTEPNISTTSISKRNSSRCNGAMRLLFGLAYRKFTIKSGPDPDEVNINTV